jgi:hypothetical protein
MESHFKNSSLKLRSPANKFTRAGVVNKDYNGKVTHFDKSNRRNIQLAKEIKEEAADESMTRVMSMPALRHKRKFQPNKNGR